MDFTEFLMKTAATDPKSAETLSQFPDDLTEIHKHSEALFITLRTVVHACVDYAWGGEGEPNAEFWHKNARIILTGLLTLSEVGDEEAGLRLQAFKQAMTEARL